MQLNLTGERAVRSEACRPQGFAVLALLTLFTLSGCGGGGGGGDDTDSIIENFTNTFDGVDSSNQIVSLQIFPDQASTNQHAGSFDSTRSGINILNSDQTTTNISVSGTFSGSSLTLILTNPPAPLAGSYSGMFSDADTIVLNGGGGTLTLRRSGGTFTANVPGSWTGTDPTSAAWYVQLSQVVNSLSSQTFLLTGTELRNGVTAPVSGYVSVSYVELHIARSSGEVIIKGQFPTTSSAINADSITFNSGGSLVRGGTPDPRSVIFLGQDGNGHTELYNVDLLGLKQQQISQDPGSDAYVWAFYISPDRSMVAYVAGSSQTATMDVFLYTIADGSTKQLTSIGANDIYVYWAANSSAIALLARTGTSAIFNAYYQKVSDVGATLISQAKSETTEVAWSPDSCQIAYSADQDTANQVELYVTSICKGLSGKLSGLLPSATSQVGTWTWSPTADIIAYVADERVAGIPELFAVDAGTAVVQRVSGMLSSGLYVLSPQWSPNGQWIGFIVSNTTGSQTSLQTVHADGSSLSTLSGATQSPENYLLWSPDSQNLAFLYSRLDMTQYVTDMYVAAANGSGSHLVSDPMATSGGVDQTIVWNPGSSSLLYDLKTSPASFDFAVTSILGPPTEFNAIGVNTCGDISAGWSPTGDRVAFIDQSTLTSPCNVTIAAPSGAGQQTVSGTMSSKAYLSSVTWVDDGKRLLYQSTDDVQSTGFTSSATELYVSYAGGTAGIKISSIPGNTLWVYTFEVL
jgi:Tol biopolymer transport system component